MAQLGVLRPPKLPGAAPLQGRLTSPRPHTHWHGTRVAAAATPPSQGFASARSRWSAWLSSATAAVRRRPATRPRPIQAATAASSSTERRQSWPKALGLIIARKIWGTGGKKVTLSIRSGISIMLLLAMVQVTVFFPDQVFTLATTVWRVLSTELQQLNQLVQADWTRDAMVLLGATAVFVPITKKLGRSPIIAFLLIGMLMGPSCFDVIHNEVEAHLLAEIGLIVFLFEMGLEVSIKKIAAMKYDVFGLGFAQYMVSGLLIGGLAYLYDPTMPLGALVMLGGALSLSSAAFVLQLTKDKEQLGTRHGRASLGVLLFQEMAVVPLLVLLPLLASSGDLVSAAKSLLSSTGRSVLAFMIIVILAKTIFNKVFYLVSSANDSDSFLSVMFLAVILCSSITQNLGLSTTLGAFFGGVLLAETNYRYQIEADIAPFRSILLGLFFVTVGFSIDLGLLVSSWTFILPLVLSLLALKAVVVMGACRLSRISWPSTVQTSLLLAPGGEFAFVALEVADHLGLITVHFHKLLVTATALSMALTPALAKLGEWLVVEINNLVSVRDLDIEGEAMVQQAQNANQGFIAVCGYGRIGRVVCKLLDAEETCSYIAFDVDPEKADKARREGLPVFLCDISRRETMERFKIQHARLVVVCVGKKSAANHVVSSIRDRYPGLPLLVRAVDDEHQDKLAKKPDVTAVVPQLPVDHGLLSLPFGGAVMRRLGYSESEIDSRLEQERESMYTGLTGTQGLEDTFKVLDQDGDGKLTREQVARGLSNVGQSLKDFEEVYAASVDKDGSIGYEEFSKLMAKAGNS